MNSYPFMRIDNDSLLVVEAQVDFERNYFAIDTGASQTLIDFNLLLMLGYSNSDFVGLKKFETANGLIEANVLKIQKINALGITQVEFEVCTFDFLQRGLISEFSGLIGLDFFENKKVCLDFRESEITIS